MKVRKGNPHLLQAQQALDNLFGEGMGKGRQGYYTLATIFTVQQDSLYLRPKDNEGAKRSEFCSPGIFRVQDRSSDSSSSVCVSV